MKQEASQDPINNHMEVPKECEEEAKNIAMKESLARKIPEVSVSSLKLLNVLASGGFSKVYRAKLDGYAEEVAIKAVSSNKVIFRFG